MAGHVARMEGGKGQTVFWWEPEDRDHLEDRKLGGWITVRRTLTSGVRDMCYILLAQDRDRWQAFVQSVINFRFA
jgi:hypothetical protein